MTNIREEYEELLKEFKKVKAQTARFQKHIEECGNDFKEFEKLFVGGSLSRNAKVCGQEIKAATEKFKKSSDSEIGKLPEMEEYFSLLKERDLLNSAGIQLAVLLNETGSEQSQALIETLLGNNPNERVSSYKKRVFTLSKEAKDQNVIRQIFKVKHEKNEVNFDKYDVGKTVKLGSYGNEAIEWLVLDKKEDSCLLISKYGLDAKPYNEECVNVTWENCTLRKWLNSDFLSTVFDSGIQNAIQMTAVDNSKPQGNPSYSTDGGNNTQDKVFLLSCAEAKKYFATDEARKCAPTDYAVKQGAWTSSSEKADGKAAGWWWLRSPGGDGSIASGVSIDGSLGVDFVHFTHEVLRPAFWLNLRKL